MTGNGVQSEKDLDHDEVRVIRRLREIRQSGFGELIVQVRAGRIVHISRKHSENLT